MEKILCNTSFTKSAFFSSSFYKTLQNRIVYPICTSILKYKNISTVCGITKFFFHVKKNNFVKMFHFMKTQFDKDSWSHSHFPTFPFTLCKIRKFTLTILQNFVKSTFSLRPNYTITCFHDFFFQFRINFASFQIVLFDG